MVLWVNPSRDNLGGFFNYHLKGNGGDKEVLFGVTVFLAIVFLRQLGHWADNRNKRIVLSLLAGIGFYVGTMGSLLFYKLALLYDEQSVIIFLVSGFFTIGLSMVFRRVLGRYKYIVLILIVSSFSIILGGFTFSMPAAEMSSWLVSAGYVLFIFFFCTADLSRRLNGSRAMSDEDGIGKWGWGFIALSLMTNALDEVSLTLFQPMQLPQVRGGWLLFPLAGILILLGHYKSKFTLRG
ncbi:MAG: hypothetical protein KGZ63_11565 [Clostridiales bacterium]|nr:hypothetical protein [Clostridiales bacterium]